MQEFHFFVCVRAKREVLIALFCEESLEQIDAKDVELIRNGSVQEFFRFKAFITLEQVNTSVKTSMEWLLINRCKLSLYANESCDEHAVYFRR